MITLAAKLGCTAPVSPLLRKARRLGFGSLDRLLALAVARGCRHYAPSGEGEPVEDPGSEQLPDDELTVLLLLGEHPYQPVAVRCAAQLARSPQICPERLAFLAKRERVERVLAHIVGAGLEHDQAAQQYWRRLRDLLADVPPRPEPDLPHWSRFVSMPGRQRHGVEESRWLTPSS
jgi:hypothetical protein